MKQAVFIFQFNKSRRFDKIKFLKINNNTRTILKINKRNIILLTINNLFYKKKYKK